MYVSTFFSGPADSKEKSIIYYRNIENIENNVVAETTQCLYLYHKKIRITLGTNIQCMN